MLGWQESTLKIHILELYDVFDNLVTVTTVSKYVQGCDKVHCGNLVTTLPPPCHNLATVSKYKVVPRLSQGCIVTTL